MLGACVFISEKGILSTPSKQEEYKENGEIPATSTLGFELMLVLLAVALILF